MIVGAMPLGESRVASMRIRGIAPWRFQARRKVRDLPHIRRRSRERHQAQARTTPMAQPRTPSHENLLRGRNVTHAFNQPVDFVRGCVAGTSGSHQAFITHRQALYYRGRVKISV